MDQLSWYVVRSSGLVAWGFGAASVVWGLLLSTRLLGRRPTGPWLLDLHRFLGSLTVAFVAVHLMALWADSYTHWAWAELFVPFETRWRPGATAWGILAAYLLVAVQATSRFMHRMPRTWWKAVHWTSVVGYGASTLHLLQAGSEADNPLLRSAVVAVTVLVLSLLAARMVRPRRAAPSHPARSVPLVVGR